jgi:DNA-binding beta-propeller fold protein YncE
MITKKMLILKLIFLFLLLSACSGRIPATDSQATSIPKVDYVQGVGRILSSTPTTVFPQKIHVSQDAIWYWFEECSCVVRLDPKTGKEIASIKIGDGKAGPYGNPKDMAVDGNMIWVTDAGHSAVARIDPNTNQIAEEIPLEFSNVAGKTQQIQPFGLALDGKTLWASDFDQNLVVRVDTETKKIIAVIPDIKNPEGIAANFNGIWIVEHRSDKIARIDPATNTITATVPIPTPENATPNGRCGMCMDYVVATEDAVWVPLNLGNGVARIDPNTNEVSAVISLDFSPRTLAVAENSVWTAGGFARICASAPGGIARIDVQTNTVVGTISVPCAASVGVFQGAIWVGSGLPGDSMMTQVKPDSGISSVR